VKLVFSTTDPVEIVKRGLSKYVGTFEAWVASKIETADDPEESTALEEIAGIVKLAKDEVAEQEKEELENQEAEGLAKEARKRAAEDEALGKIQTSKKVSLAESMKAIQAGGSGEDNTQELKVKDMNKRKESRGMKTM